MADRPDPDAFTRALAAESLADGSPTAWFDRLYVASGRGEVDVPWDRGEAHPVLVDWLAERTTAPGTAVVVGCGPGHDAELLAARGHSVTAFEISRTAVEQARAKNPGTRVDHRVADLLDLPPEWAGGFDLVVEIMTVQSMPRGVRTEAIAAVRSLVGPGGTLLVVGAVPPDAPGAAPEQGPPWPLDRSELESFALGGLRMVALDQLASTLGGGARRWRAELVRDTS